MRRIIFVIALFTSLSAPVRVAATDLFGDNSLAPVYMDIKNATIIVSQNLGLVRAFIPDPAHWIPYDTDSTFDGYVYLGVDLTTSGGSQLFNDVQRAMRTGARLVVRCKSGTINRLIVKENSGGGYTDTLKYWIPELIRFPE